MWGGGWSVSTKQTHTYTHCVTLSSTTGRSLVFFFKQTFSMTSLVAINLFSSVDITRLSHPPLIPPAHSARTVGTHEGTDRHRDERLLSFLQPHHNGLFASDATFDTNNTRAGEHVRASPSSRAAGRMVRRLSLPPFRLYLPLSFIFPSCWFTFIRAASLAPVWNDTAGSQQSRLQNKRRWSGRAHGLAIVG